MSPEALGYNFIHLNSRGVANYRKSWGQHGMDRTDKSMLYLTS